MNVLPSQIGLGVAVVAVVAALYFGLRSKKSSQPIIPDVPKKKRRGFTAAELQLCKGEKGQPLYVGVKGVIYSVSPQFYGPGAAYDCFAGVEASRNLARGTISDNEANASWRCLNETEMETLDGWAERFAEKYEVVGWFVPDEEYEARGKQLQERPPEE